MAHSRKPLSLHERWVITLAVLGGAVFGAPAALWAQKRAAPARPTQRRAAPAEQKPRYKAIWEPINYKEDLQLTDVFFVNEKIGWVSGSAGTILHTADGGDTWTVQLGGDPQSKEKEVKDLRFINETHGWAVKEEKLLRTTDGENWEEVGRIGETFGYYEDYVFSSPTHGVQIVKEDASIHRTQDGGRTWQQVNPPCSAKAEVQGLTQNITCRLKSLNFPSAQVGYAAGGGPHASIFVLKTEDGGATWNAVYVMPEATGEDEMYFRQEIFFTDENTGFLAAPRYGKMFATADGGKTWHGVVASVKSRVRFADPEVGWSIDSQGTLSYTNNGGKTWNSRQTRFPATVKSFSLPRRNRGYVVGDHGMIYRYRIVPVDYSAPKALEGPVMPGAKASGAE